ncbi:PREDICTED: tryptase-2-like [Papilio polytes]|uniref:tryptase-2-like n=1 Tax=Papilio polytes TaxID=76194 RepID=UPI0006763912|nr:PREDICTED: tryptase-2-like [Papilio polytes]
MRLVLFFVGLVSSLCVAAGQSSDDLAAALVQNAGGDAGDGDLNLDPVVVETKIESCTTMDGLSGICVKYYQCDQESKTVIEDGYTIIDVRSGSCAKFLEVCCGRNKVNNKTRKESTTPAPAVLSDDNTESTPRLDSLDTETSVIGRCGVSNPGAAIFTDVRIDDNTPVPIDDRKNADFGEYPWMVAILRRYVDEETWDKNNYKGGGTLIHPSVVMTVAHKISGMNPEDLKVRVGDYDTSSLNEQNDHQEINVRKIVIHPNYFRTSSYNNIALLFLERPVVINSDYPQIGVACLRNSLPPANTTCFSMGWGAANFNNKNIYASTLKKVKLQLLDNTVCHSLLRKTRLGPFFRLHPSLVCAGGEQGIDTCKGDGGSPLVCRDKPGSSRYIVYGMVAWGLACGDKDIPGVYVNVPALYDWINTQVSAEGYDTKVYTIT